MGQEAYRSAVVKRSTEISNSFYKFQMWPIGRGAWGELFATSLEVYGSRGQPVSSGQAVNKNLKLILQISNLVNWQRSLGRTVCYFFRSLWVKRSAEVNRNFKFILQIQIWPIGRGALEKLFATSLEVYGHECYWVFSKSMGQEVKRSESTEIFHRFCLQKYFQHSHSNFQRF